MMDSVTRFATAQREITTAPVGYEDQLLPPEETAPPLSVLVGKTRLDPWVFSGGIAFHF